MKTIAFVLPKAWVNPFGKMPFLRPSKMFLIVKKKVSFLSRASLSLISSLILTENKKMKKIAFLDQGHWLTSLEK